MTTPKLNSGSVYQREFESCFNAVRRFLIANPTLSKHTSSKFAKERGELSAFDAMVINSQSTHYWETNQWLYGGKWNKHYRPGITLREKSCQTCMEQLFHCHLYSLPWVRFCPIHRRYLTDHCLSCGEHWSFSTRYYKNDCPTCGAPTVVQSAIRRNWLTEYSAEQFDAINLFWSLIYNQTISLSVVYYDYLADGIGVGVSEANQEFPQVQFSLHPEQEPLFSSIGAPTDRLLMKRFSYTLLTSEDLRSTPINETPEPSSFTEITDRVSQELRGFSHYAPEDNFLKSVYMDSLKITTSNLLSLAYEIWENTLIIHKPRQMASRISACLFKILGVDLPSHIPIPRILLCRRRGIALKPDKDFIAWYYEESILDLYTFILKHLVLFRFLVENSDYNLANYTWHKGDLMWHSRYMCCGIFLDDVNCIKVVYESRFPSIKTIEIDSGNSLLRKCSFGHSSLKYEQESDELFGRYLISQQSDNLFDCLLADPRYKLNEWRVQSNKVHIDRELSCYNKNFIEQRRRPSLQEGLH